MTAASVSIGGWNSTGTDMFGVTWRTTDMSGFEDTAPTRIAFPAMAGADGATDQRGFEDARVVTWTGVAVAPDRFTRQAAKGRLRAALGDLNTGIDVTVHLEDGDFMSHGKRSAVAPVSPLGPFGFKYQVTVTFPDPRLYSTTLQSATTSLVDNSSDPTQRWKFPASFPNDFGGPSVGAGQVVATNSGTAVTYPTITIVGPGTNLRIDDQASGSFLGITQLFAGQFVVLDTRLHRVLLNGTSPARSLLMTGSEWFGLPVGLDVLTFSASAFTAATATFEWRSTL